MSKHRYVADFETTVYTGQESTEVWAAGITEIGDLNPDNVTIFNSIDEFMTSFKRLGFLKWASVDIYFHNLKFDGSFILNWLLKHKHHALVMSDAEIYFPKTKHMYSGSFKYLCSDRGQFFSITYKLGNTVIRFLDSAKLFPMSIEEIGNSFGTLNKKLSIEYEGVRWAGCDIKEHEKEYLQNDLLVPAEALDTFFSEGHTKSTIASCCMEEFINICGGKKEFYYLFPKLKDVILPCGINADEYIRPSYKGGYCYCTKQTHIKNPGVTLDVNSLYPFVMEQFELPYGNPTYHTKEEEFRHRDGRYAFIHFKANFRLKKGKLPTIQIKNSPLYPSNEWLKTSYILKNGKYYANALIGGIKIESRQEMTLTEIDFFLLKEHYDIYDFEVLDWIDFPAQKGMFSSYMKKYFDIKMKTRGGRRQIAKLFLNSLYGKFGTSEDSSFKFCLLDSDDKLKWYTVTEKNKETYHVAVASAITSLARYWTISHAQKNIKYFRYADTDSLHLECSLEEVKGVELHDTKIGAWACECKWDEGVFVRQKTYIERTGNVIEITAAGMGKKAKRNLCLAYKLSHGGDKKEILKEVSEKKLNAKFIENGFELEDFKKGLVVPQNMKLKNIPGGLLLYEQDFELK